MPVVTKSSTKALGTKPTLEGVRMSHEAPMKPIIVIQGKYGAGKTMLAATISDDFKSLPIAKHKGPPNQVLNDLFWISFDEGATLGFRERGISVKEFDVHDWMSKKKCSILTATEKALIELEKAVNHYGIQWVVVDTVSQFDKGLEQYWVNILRQGKNLEDLNPAEVDDKIQIPAYKRMFNSHKMLQENLLNLRVGRIYLTHAKAIGTFKLGNPDEQAKQAKARSALQTANAASLAEAGLEPDVTGKGAGGYLAPARLILFVKKVRGVGNASSREVWAEPTSEGYTTKNSFELSIVGKQEPNLKKILEKIG